MGNALLHFGQENCLRSFPSAAGFVSVGLEKKESNYNLICRKNRLLTCQQVQNGAQHPALCLFEFQATDA